MVKVRLHSTGAASRLAALLLGRILPVFSLVAPSPDGRTTCLDATLDFHRDTASVGCVRQVVQQLMLIMHIAVGRGNIPRDEWLRIGQEKGGWTNGGADSFFAYLDWSDTLGLVIEERGVIWRSRRR